MKILVTGGLGFIGSHTVVELQNQGFEVVIVDNLSNSSEEVLKGITAITNKTPLFEKLDLREKGKVQDFSKNTKIFRESFILRLRKQWAKALEIRCCIMKIILIRWFICFRNCNKNQRQTFIFSSSCTVYGQAEKNANYRKRIHSTCNVAIRKYEANRRRNHY